MSINGLAQISIYVSDHKASEEFYRSVFGFKAVHELTLPITPDMNLGVDEGEAFITFMDLGSLRIELVEMPNGTKRADGPIDHITFNVTDIDAVMEDMRKKGIVFETRETLSGGYLSGTHSRFILFRGPDGEHIELTEILPD